MTKDQGLTKSGDLTPETKLFFAAAMGGVLQSNGEDQGAMDVYLSVEKEVGAAAALATPSGRRASLPRLVRGPLRFLGCLRPCAGRSANSLRTTRTWPCCTASSEQLRTTWGGTTRRTSALSEQRWCPAHSLPRSNPIASLPVAAAPIHMSAPCSKHLIGLVLSRCGR